MITISAPVRAQRKRLGRKLLGGFRRHALGSLQARVALEVKQHCTSNVVIRRSRYSIARRLLQALLRNHSLGWFLSVYLALNFVITLAEFVAAGSGCHMLPGWTSAETKALLKDAAGFLITGQVGILAIVSVAVGLVTLIAQRDDRS